MSSLNPSLMAALWALKNDDTMISDEQRPLTPMKIWINVVDGSKVRNGAGPRYIKHSASKQLPTIEISVGLESPSQTCKEATIFTKH